MNTRVHTSTLATRLGTNRLSIETGLPMTPVEGRPITERMAAIRKVTHTPENQRYWQTPSWVGPKRTLEVPEKTACCEPYYLDPHAVDCPAMQPHTASECRWSNCPEHVWN